MQPLRVLNIVATPVVIELEAGEVLIAVVDRSGFSQRLVAVAADAQGYQDVAVGLELDRDEQQVEPNVVEHAVGDDIVGQGRERFAVLHGQGDEHFTCFQFSTLSRRQS